MRWLDLRYTVKSLFVRSPLHSTRVNKCALIMKRTALSRRSPGSSLERFALGPSKARAVSQAGRQAGSEITFYGSIRAGRPADGFAVAAVMQSGSRGERASEREACTHAVEDPRDLVNCDFKPRTWARFNDAQAINAIGLTDGW